jgi:hypothetical protein
MIPEATTADSITPLRECRFQQVGSLIFGKIARNIVSGRDSQSRSVLNMHESETTALDADLTERWLVEVFGAHFVGVHPMQEGKRLVVDSRIVCSRIMGKRVSNSGNHNLWHITPSDR